MPTVGFSAPVRTRMCGWSVVFYDLGGGARIRGVWPQYFADVHGVVFVVDSADAARVPEAAKELHTALQHPMLVGKPTLMCVGGRPAPLARTQLPLTHSLTHTHTHTRSHLPRVQHRRAQPCQQSGPPRSAV